MNGIIFSKRLYLALALASLFATQAWASHPYHVSKAEVAWNSKTGNFEVAMCVWPADLEKALTARADKPVDLDKVENLDELLKSYVESKFIVRKRPEDQQRLEGKQGKSQPSPASQIRWVGHEKNNKEAWLYFEVTGNKLPAQWTITNRIFFELNDDQLNQIQLKVGAKLSSHISTLETKPHAIETAAAKVKRADSKIVIGQIDK